MRNLVAKRLPASVQDLFSGREELIDYLALASFGLPRGFLNMISDVVTASEGQSRPTRQQAEAAVSEHAESVRGVFNALGAKLPRYRNFVETGKTLESALVRTLTSYNRLQDSPDKRTTIVGIEEPLSNAMDRMLNMLEYAGVVRRQNSVSRGVKGQFLKFSLHNSIATTESTLALGKSFPLSAIIESLTTKNSAAFARAKDTSLLGPDYEARCTLALPPCPACSTPRTSGEQRFCMRCGKELPDVSLYEELLRSPISVLPLTENRVTSIISGSPIRTVHDILLDDERQNLRQVPGIGRVWAKRIRTMAEEFVSV